MGCINCEGIPAPSAQKPGFRHPKPYLLESPAAHSLPSDRIRKPPHDEGAQRGMEIATARKQIGYPCRREICSDGADTRSTTMATSRSLTFWRSIAAIARSAVAMMPTQRPLASTTGTRRT